VSIQSDNVELLDNIESRHPDVNAFQSAKIDEAVAGAKAAGGYIGNVLRSELLSVGIYVLPAGGADTQQPHEQDEVYYAVRGRAKFQVGSEDHAVAPGALLFVAARQAHHFHEIDEELVLVVFWAPPHDR
jgi:mannose-6-phosphate isomerase-like protein (cupin superfamily)